MDEWMLRVGGAGHSYCPLVPETQTWTTRQTRVACWDVKFHLCIVNLILAKTKRYGSFQQHSKVNERKVGQLNSWPDDGNNLTPCYDQRKILYIEKYRHYYHGVMSLLPSYP